MKVMYVVHGFPPRVHTGTESYTFHLAQSVSAQHEVHVFYLYRDREKPLYEIERAQMGRMECFGVNYELMADSNRFRHTYSIPRLNATFRQCLAEFRPDIVHATYLLAGLSADFVKIAKESGAKVVVTLTDFLPLCLRGQLLDYRNEICSGPETDYKCSKCVWMVKRIRKGIFETVRIGLLHVGPVAWLARRIIARMISGRRRAIKDALNRADAVITPTPALREQYVKWGLPENKTRRLGYGIDAKLFAQFKRTPSDAVRFGFIGQALPHKGLHVLLEAAEMLKDRKFEVVVCAGTDLTGSKKYVEGLRGLLALKQVSWRGTFPFDKIADAYAQFDALVVPSLWYENSPLVVLYAQQSQTPLIVSDFGGLTEFVRNGETGLVFEPGNARALAGAMARFIESPSLYAEMAGKITPPPSIDDNAARVMEIYAELMK
jgi:glycosyltransferase involved in cell wall biosynthesis